MSDKNFNHIFGKVNVLLDLRIGFDSLGAEVFRSLYQLGHRTNKRLRIQIWSCMPNLSKEKFRRRYDLSL